MPWYLWVYAAVGLFVFSATTGGVMSREVWSKCGLWLQIKLMVILLIGSLLWPMFLVWAKAFALQKEDLQKEDLQKEDD